MKKSSKIELVTIRRHHLGLTGIIYSEGYAYALRFAPNTAVTESLIRKLWQESRQSFHPHQRHDRRNHLSPVWTLNAPGKRRKAASL
jgi:DNA polymerase IIIc chi subunit